MSRNIKNGISVTKGFFEGEGNIMRGSELKGSEDTSQRR